MFVVGENTTMTSVKHEIDFILNGTPVTVSIPVHWNALTMLRESLGLTGTKYGCGEGECGACTILVDGVSVNSCLMFAVDCDGREITTIEGVATDEGLSSMQSEFVKQWAVQCGFCSPGMIMQGMYLLKRNPSITREEIKRGIEGNLCRCTGYTKIIDAIAEALHEGEEVSA